MCVCVSPVLCGAEEGDPGVEVFSLGGRREIHGFRETCEEQLQQLRPEQTSTQEMYLHFTVKIPPKMYLARKKCGKLILVVKKLLNLDLHHKVNQELSVTC